MLPPLPFPFPLHVGTDICHIPRVRRILDGGHAVRFIRFILAPEELTLPNSLPRRMLAAAHRRAEMTSQIWEGIPGGGQRLVRSRRHEEVKLTSHAQRVAERWLGGLPEADKKKRWELIQDLEAYEKKNDALYGNAARHLAARFAAKEAAFKAHPHLRLMFHDVLIRKPKDTDEELPPWKERSRIYDAPFAVIRPGPGMRDRIARVSISHDHEYTTAVCMGWCEQGPQEDG